MWNSAFSTSLRYFAGKGNTVQFFILTKLGIFFRIFAPRENSLVKSIVQFIDKFLPT